MRISLGFVLLFLAVPAVLAQPSALPAPNTPPNPCAVPEQKQLEFWVGDWDLTWPGEKQGELDHGTKQRSSATGQLRRAREFFRRQDHAPARDKRYRSSIRAPVSGSRPGSTTRAGISTLSVNSRMGQMILTRDGVRPDGTQGYPAYGVQEHHGE